MNLTRLRIDNTVVSKLRKFIKSIETSKDSLLYSILAYSKFDREILYNVDEFRLSNELKIYRTKNTL